MPDKPVEKIVEEYFKKLETKYNVMVKRTNSIISSLNEVNSKLDYLIEKMSMFELMEEDDEDIEDEYEKYLEDEDEDEDEED